jgi:hypothetical protein
MLQRHAPSVHRGRPLVRGGVAWLAAGANDQPRGKPVIYELRQYTFQAGKVPAYLEVAEKIGRPVRGNDYGVNHGYWTVEFGPLNQVWHLWSFPSLDERTRLRGELAKNERWTKEYIPQIRPLLIRQDIRLMNAVKDVTPPATAGNVYEMRIYRTQVGRAGEWANLFKSYFPAREKYSKNVGLWTGEAPQPNEALHMWTYPDVNARMATRAQLAKDPDWKDFLVKGAGIVVEMQSTLLLPTAFSPMK